MIDLVSFLMDDSYQYFLVKHQLITLKFSWLGFSTRIDKKVINIKKITFGIYEFSVNIKEK